MDRVPMSARVRPCGSLPRARHGMSLIEVMVAMIILTGVLLVLGGFSAKFSQASAQVHLVITANEIAASRLDEIRSQSSYDALDSLGYKTAGDTIVANQTKFLRITTVLHKGGVTSKDSTDYKIVTVAVSHPAMRKVVSKTTAMAAF
jgi:prepilin-type N-terminal cleavage/methylation domain-containing protein